MWLHRGQLKRGGGSYGTDPMPDTFQQTERSDEAQLNDTKRWIIAPILPAYIENILLSSYQ